MSCNGSILRGSWCRNGGGTDHQEWRIINYRRRGIRELRWRVHHGNKSRRGDHNRRRAVYYRYTGSRDGVRSGVEGGVPSTVEMTPVRPGGATESGIVVGETMTLGPVGCPGLGVFAGGFTAQPITWQMALAIGFPPGGV
jgi:hypothetical protein